MCRFQSDERSNGEDMGDDVSTLVQDYFIRRFSSDPDRIHSLTDVEKIERVSHEERFPCRSPIDAIAYVSEKIGDQIALRYLPNGRVSDAPLCWTYRDYHEEIIRAANLFHSLGLQSGESVLLLLPNVPEMLFALWGAQAAGIAAPVNPFLQPEQIASIADEANAKIIVTLQPVPGESDGLFEKAMQVCEMSSAIISVVTIGQEKIESLTKSRLNLLDWNSATQSQPSDNFIFERGADNADVAAYFHTGGTTGSPKLAQHTHRAQAINICQMQMTGPDLQNDINFSNRTVILCGLPLFHVNAVCVSALNAVMSGGELVLAGPDGFRNAGTMEDFWALIEKYAVTFFAAVPTIYAALIRHDVEKYNLSSLISCSSGAAPIPVSLFEEFRSQTGIDITEGYGMTETTCGASTHYFYGARPVGSIGLRLPYHEMRAVVLDEQGHFVRDCGEGEVGVLLHKGPNVTVGYKQNKINAEAWPEPEWFNSGDLARFDKDGCCWLAGRRKDVIIRGGHNIDPLITEESVMAHPDVEMAGAVGKPDSYSGEVPVAYVKLIPGSITTSHELLRFAKEHCAERAAAPVEVIIREALPLTAVGKIFKPELRKDIIKRTFLAEVEDVCPNSEISVWVEDDAKKGLKVLLNVSSKTIDLDIVCRLLEEKLGRFSLPWEIVL